MIKPAYSPEQWENDCVGASIEERATQAAPQPLDEVRDFIARFCAFPDEHCLAAVTLWAAHTHIAEQFHVSPRLAFLSPEPASGKTRALEVLDLLVPEPMFTLNASPPAIFRTLAKGPVTLLFDEVDAVWSKRGKDDDHQDLRALLNAGYKLGATIPRCVGAHHEVISFPVFCPVALAGLGDMPDTIMSRSIIIRMRRRAPGERVDEFRTRIQEPEGHRLRDRLTAWADGVADEVSNAWPEMPGGVVDRPAELWEPLLAIADEAGGQWPDAARQACMAMVAAAEDRTVSLGIRLLGDLRTIFDNADALHTETILQRLTDGDGLDDDAPWGELRGKPLGARGLASMLRKYGAKSKDVNVGGATKKGYRRDELWDAWERYLPRVESAKGQHGQHGQLLASYKGSRGSGKVADVAEVADRPGEKVAEVAFSEEEREKGQPLQASAGAKSSGGSGSCPYPEGKSGACPRCAGEGCMWCRGGAA